MVNGTSLRWFFPSIEKIHAGLTGGHLGLNKTLSKIKDNFYWLNCKKRCIPFIARMKKKKEDLFFGKGTSCKNACKIGQHFVGSPFERVGIDLVGPFPKTEKENRYMLVVFDYISKWPDEYALPNQEALTVANALVGQWITRIGVPLELHWD